MPYTSNPDIDDAMSAIKEELVKDLFESLDLSPETSPIAFDYSED